MREADEVSAWISDRVAIASSEEMGKHLEHVELLQKKFDDFLKVYIFLCACMHINENAYVYLITFVFHQDLQANESRITSTNEMAKRLLDEQHPDSNLILSKQKVNQLLLIALYVVEYVYIMAI